MAKVTSKLQVTIPKAIAEQYGIVPGDEIDFSPAGPQIRVALGNRAGHRQLSLAERLRLFDAARSRQRRRERTIADTGGAAEHTEERDWTREELYSRGQTADDHAD